MNTAELIEKLPLSGSGKNWSKAEKLFDSFNQSAQLDVLNEVLEMVENYLEETGAEVAPILYIRDEVRKMIEANGGEWEIDD